MISELKNLGLKENEIKIYLLVLEYKKILPSTLSYISKINRTTTYMIIKKLKEKNLIGEDIGGKNKSIIALPIENIYNIIEREKQILLQKENFAENVIKNLSEKFNSSRNYIPKLQYIEEDNLENFLYSNTEKWSSSILKYDNIWWGFQDPTFVNNYLNWMDWQWKNVDKNLEIKFFTNLPEIEKKIKGRYEKRNVKSSSYFGKLDSTMWILGDYVVTIFTNEKPFHLLEIYNPILAKNLRSMFSEIWGK